MIDIAAQISTRKVAGAFRTLKSNRPPTQDIGIVITDLIKGFLATEATNELSSGDWVRHGKKETY